MSAHRTHTAADGMTAWDLSARAAAASAAARVLAVLLTDRDDRASWVCAGQALERVLLVATKEGVSSSLLTQPLELVESRWAARDAVAAAGHAQVVLRMGYGGEGPTGPRRPVSAVLQRS